MWRKIVLGFRSLLYDLQDGIHHVKGFFYRRQAWHRIRKAQRTTSLDEFDQLLQLDAVAMMYMSSEEVEEYRNTVSKTRIQMHEATLKQHSGD